MTFAYQVTQFNGIDYSTKSPKWNLVAERRTQQQALAVCQTLNQWGYPAKDRSGQLEVLEEPHLGKLLTKISGRDANKKLDFASPNSSEGSK